MHASSGTDIEPDEDRDDSEEDAVSKKLDETVKEYKYMIGKECARLINK